MDVSINKPFKDKFRKMYTDWMAFGDHTYTPAGNMKKPSVQNILEWIDQCWKGVEESVVQKSWKKCGISNNMDGTENNILWENSNSESSNEEILKFFSQMWTSKNGMRVIHENVRFYKTKFPRKDFFARTGDVSNTHSIEDLFCWPSEFEPRIPQFTYSPSFRRSGW